MDQCRIRRGGDRVCGRRLAGLRQLLAQRSLGAVQRARQPVGDVVRQAFAREHKTPGADGIDRRRLVRIAVGRHRQRLQECMLGADARDLAGVGRDEPGAAGRLRHRGKTRPADAGAPQRRGTAVLHHRGAIAGAVEIDRLEILVLLQPDAVEHVARQDRQTRAFGAERNRLADQIPDRLIRTVGAHHEHAGTGIHRGEDLQLGRRPPDAHEGFVGRLAGHQRDIELVGFQHRDVFVGALGVARLDRKRRIGGVHDFRERIAIDREAAARRRRSQADCGLGNGLAAILRRGGAGKQQQNGPGDPGEFHFWPQAVDDG